MKKQWCLLLLLVALAAKAEISKENQAGEPNIEMVADSGEVVFDDVPLDEFDDIFPADAPEPEKRTTYVDYVPTWVKSWGLEALIQYMLLKEYLAEKWADVKNA